MHELSIVQSIIDIAETTVVDHRGKNVERIDLEIGQLAGVEPAALDFAWETAIRGTVLEKAERKIDHIEGVGRCGSCGKEFRMDQLFDPCPVCNSFLNEIVQGKELRVKSITIN